MTPRVHRSDPVTWDGVEIMISAKLEEYDGRAILIRDRDVEENKEAFKSVWKELARHSRILNEWKWPIKLAMAMLTAILIGVAGIVLAVIKHGIANLLR